MTKFNKVFKVLILVGVCVAAACSCGQNDPSHKKHKTTIVVTKPINVDPAADYVKQSIFHNKQATSYVKSATIEVQKAKQRSIEADSLIEDLKEINSAYVPAISNVNDHYKTHINIVEGQLNNTGVVLKQQLVALKSAELELVKAKEQSIASENEKTALRAEKVALEESLLSMQDELKRASEYKDKYYKLLKYKWIVWGIGVWMLVKFLGSMGAWSPQGRAAKFLIG